MTRPKKQILLTGASGFLGWNFCQLAKHQYQITALYHSNPVDIDQVKTQKVDITDLKALKKCYKDTSPDAIIHLAAMSKPNDCELYPEQSKKVNIDATKNLLILAQEQNIPIIMASTDLVFNGLNPPYSEQDPVSPICVYGQHKAKAEQLLIKSYDKATVCRMPLMFGNPGPRAQNWFMNFYESLKQGKPIKVFRDEYRTPVDGKTAVQGLILALENNIRGILHLGGKEPISRYHFGLMMTDLLSFDEQLVCPILQSELTMPAARPPNVSLDSSKAFKLGYAVPSLEDQIKRYQGCQSLQA